MAGQPATGPVHPTVMSEPAVQVYVWPSTQPQSDSRPSLVVELEVQLRVMLTAPASVVPASRTPASEPEQDDAERTQVPTVGQNESPLGPELLPASQAPGKVHQPQRVSAAQAAQLVMVEQGAAQEPQSPGQLAQVSVPLQLPSPQRGAHAPQSAEHEVQLSPL